MDKSKWEIYFHNPLGIKGHVQTGGNAVLSGQQKTTKRSGGTCYKGRGCYYGLCTVVFSNGVYMPMDFDIDVGNDNEIFSSH